MSSETLFEIVHNIIKSTLKYEPKYNSIIEALFEVLSENGSKIVLVDNDTGREWSATELINAIVTLSVKLSARGISNGDTVAFFCPNSDLHVIAMLSVWAIGAIYTGLIHQSPLRELKNVITKSNAKYLVGSKETIDVCDEFISSNSLIKKFFVIDEISNADISSIHSMIMSTVEYKDNEEFFQLMSNVKSSDLCKVSFSSGTTGEPKAVAETQARYIACSRFYPPEISLVANTDICIFYAPLAHIAGSMTVCFRLLKRARLVVFSHFDCDNFIKDVQKHGITFTTLGTSHINLLNRSVSEPLNSFCLKKVITGGEFPLEIICKEFIEKFQPEYFAQGYGTTEAGMPTIVPIYEGKRNLKTVGVPTPGYEMKIVDPETGEILGANKIGEIRIKGPQTTEYLNNEKANRESFDEQSFFKSGDIGYFDERGYLYVIDRIKEIIKYNTQQVSPTELQSILMQHESVKEAAVVGIPDEVYGQLPKAFVVLKKEFKDKVNENELLEFVNSRVMDFKRLRGGLTFINEIPKSSIGKIDRRALKSI